MRGLCRADSVGCHAGICRWGGGIKRSQSENCLYYSVAQNPESPENYLGYGDSGNDVYVAYRLPREAIKSFAGGKITGIVAYSGNGMPDEINAFITRDPSFPPLATGSFTKPSNVCLAQLPVSFSNPYEIIGNEESLYIGYYCRQSNKSNWIPVDNKPAASENLIVGSSSSGSLPTKWQNVGDKYGSLCMQTVIEGLEAVPFAEVKAGDFPGTIKTGEPLKYSLKVSNKGNVDITSLTFTTTTREYDNEVYTVPLTQPLEPGEATTVWVRASAFKSIGESDVTITSTEINRKEVAAPASFSAKTLVFDKGYPRTSVIETFTGAWCGFCPADIEASKFIKGKYGDNVIEICIHNGDRMALENNDYANALGISGYPTMVVNRNRAQDLGPTGQNIVDEIDRIVPQSYTDDTYCGIDLKGTISEDGKSAAVTVNTSFSLPLKRKVRVFLVTTADGVGPYEQTNYFNSGNYVNPLVTGWIGKGDKVSVTFDNVATYAGSPLGIEGSLPESIDKDTPYTYTAEIPLSNGNQTNIIAMVIDGETGEIINAQSIKPSKEGSPVGPVNPEDPENPDFVNLTVSVENGVELNLQAPKGKQTRISHLLDDSWEISELAFNGADHTGAISEGFFTTPALEEDSHVHLKVAYKGDLEILDAESRIHELGESGITVSVNDGKIHIKGLSGENVTVWNTGAHTVFSRDAVMDAMTVTLPSGTYILRVGVHAVKVIV